MAAGSSPTCSSSNSDTSQQVDRIAQLYPKVDESETTLPRSWSPKDKFTFIGLSQNNLRVHYKGRYPWAFLSSIFSSSEHSCHSKLNQWTGLSGCFRCYIFALNPAKQTCESNQPCRGMLLEGLHNFMICLRFIVNIEALFDASEI